MNKEPKDKRTKEYKYWKLQYGLGDLVEDAIKTVAPKFAEKKKDCNTCKERKDKLNNLLTFRKVSVKRCMNEKQRIAFKTYTANHKANKWTIEEIQFLITLYAWVFALQYKVSDLCTSCKGSGEILKNIHDKLNDVYKEITIR